MVGRMMSYLDGAIKNEYTYLSGADNKQKITYVTSDNYTENYNESEEKVRTEFWTELIYKYE